MPRAGTLTAIAIAMLLATPSTAAAEIYRWVDDEGVVHYSQQPPGDRAAKRVEAARPPADDPEQRRAATEDLRESNRVHFHEQRLKREEQARERERQADLRDFCNRLRGKREKLANSPKVRAQTEDGYRVMSYEERQQKLQVFDRRLAEHCGSG